MSFLEIQFRPEIDLEPMGGPAYLTSVKKLRSGAEHRNATWADPLRRYSFSIPPTAADNIQWLLHFLADVRGQLYGFRIKDWLDYGSNEPNSDVTPIDQTLGTGDGTTYYFRMYKDYGSNGYRRRITKPVVGSVTVAIDGVESPPDEWFLDSVNGVVVFITPPAVDEEITCGFRFDVPARFDSDIQQLSMIGHKMAAASMIELQEIRVKEEIDTDAYDTLRGI